MSSEYLDERDRIYREDLKVEAQKLGNELQSYIVKHLRNGHALVRLTSAGNLFIFDNVSYSRMIHVSVLTAMVTRDILAYDAPNDSYQLKTSDPGGSRP